MSQVLVDVSTTSSGESGESVFLWEGRESITCIRVLQVLVSLVSLCSCGGAGESHTFR